MMALVFIGGEFRQADKVEPVIDDAVEAAHCALEGWRTIGVNDYQTDVAAPLGGVKASGIGRELGPEGLAAYQTLKSIYRVGPSD
jgi:acyl-CoA reductase-like NAD-dependent aldehyde dehydrogenase